MSTDIRSRAGSVKFSRSAKRSSNSPSVSRLLSPTTSSKLKHGKRTISEIKDGFKAKLRPKSRSRKSLDLVNDSDSVIRSSASSSLLAPMIPVASTTSAAPGSTDTEDDVEIHGDFSIEPEVSAQVPNMTRGLTLKTNIAPTSKDTIKTPVIKVSSLQTPQARPSAGHQSGILSSFIGSLNLKTLGSLGSKTGIFSEDETPIEDNQSISDSILRSPSPSADSVTFKPVKKSLFSTLGQGGLTLASVIGTDPHNPDLSSSNLRSPNFSYDPPKKRSSGSDTSFSVQRSPNSVRSKSIVDSEALKNLDESLDDYNNENPSKRVRLSTSRIDDPSSEHPSELATVESHDAALAQRLGVKIPSDKRQEAFHQLFPEAPPSDTFIEDFACAYRRDILIQGRIYLSEKYVSFHSNIIGLVTHFVVPLTKIVDIEKKKTMGIPNALEFSTLHDKFTFASLMSRDATFDLMFRLWSSGDRRTLDGDENLSTLDIGVDDDEEFDSQDSASEDDSDYDDESDNEARRMSMTDNEEGAAADGTSRVREQVEDDSDADSTISNPESMIKDTEEDVKNAGTFNGIAFEGPRRHSATSFDYTEEDGETSIIEVPFEAPMGVVYNLLFGDDTTFMKKSLEVQGNFNVDKLPKFDSHGKRQYFYMRPINGPVGPKQTRCNITEQVEKKDFEFGCCVVQTSETPDVPSGNSFRVRTRYFFHWAERYSTTLSVYSSIVWSGKSWIKGAVERGAINGQKKGMEMLVKEIRSKIRENASGKAKVRRKTVSKRSRQKNGETEPSRGTVEPTLGATESSWFQFFESSVDIKSLLIFIMFLLLIWSRYCPYEPKSGKRMTYRRGGYLATLDDTTFDSDVMLQSEADLWEWIDRRHSSDIQDSPSRSFPLSSFDRDPKLIQSAGAKLNTQELKETVRLMEKRLEILRQQAEIE
ncbi:hypothetical protein FOA43_001819 [Brettanomyces nanus]|uniref:VASt domain-containing protein n=1 Tax=Eeniella nana TaxID=13502 RepID=A0A875S3Y7_EENNA|nr:uncharacterized protein FOA43_001819 [Brettanomyces nanus]QPG74489.1 hypothetical protein FOA43_001819 [Brettanomyces nanus]